MAYRVLFPACASFGPMFIVVGLQGQMTRYGIASAGVGALMTSAALLMLFDRLADETPTVTPGRRRDWLLLWCVLTVIGVLTWLLTAR